MPRPPKLSLGQECKIVSRYKQNRSTRALASESGVSIQTVCNILRRHNIALRTRGKTTKTRKSKSLSYEIAAVSRAVVEGMCLKHHAYGSANKCPTYAFAVIEDGRPVAVFAWQPPPLGAAQSVCPEVPSGVLCLSRMVAVPKTMRRLRHISKPLRRQMMRLIDRTRWPVLVTYSDEGQGHTGHVYKCSGWQQTLRAERSFYITTEGHRASFSTSEKNRSERNLRYGGKTTLQRWEHWICAKGDAAKWMHTHGWKRIARPGRVWRSGNPAFTWIRE